MGTKRLKLVAASNRVYIYFVLTVLASATVINVSSASASTITHLAVIETNMNTSGQAALIIAFTAGASDAAGSITLAMGSAVSAVATTPPVGTTYNSVDCKTITGASNDLSSSSSFTGSGSSTTITIGNVAALTSGNSYCFVLGTYAAQTAVTNTATAASNTVTLTDGSDVGTGAVDAITSDQVSVAASVPPSFTMTIQNTSDNFASNLTSGSISATSGDTVTVSTNASHGWDLWASDANIGLHSASAGYTIASKTPGTNGTLSAGTPGYLTAIPAANITQGSGSGGTTSATTAFASSGSGNGSGLNTTPAIIASSTGTANAATVKPLEYAAVAGVTPAGGDYTDTITYIGAGSF